MEQLQMTVRYVGFIIMFLLLLGQSEEMYNEAYLVQSSTFNVPRNNIVTLDRQRRDAPALNATPVPSEGPLATTNTLATNLTKPENISAPPVTTQKPTPAPASNTTVSVTQIPLLGVNGSGILKVDPTENTTKVSEPISPNDNFLTDMFSETPERIKAEHNLTNLSYDTHLYYNSTFIGNATYFNEYWANITKYEATVHPKLSNSHRRATTVDLKFAFPYYGHRINNVTVASGGFVYVGEHTHNWLAATQYIAPLMANFDTTLTNDSYVKLSSDDDKFTAFWENVTLQGSKTKKFVFAVTLYKNGDIVFAYKNIPIDVLDIKDTEHPVKVGISDAYIDEDSVFHVKSKKIYEYHRVSLKNHEITNNTILWLTPLPTCLQYNTCDSCINHKTSFNCSWCEDMPTYKCSSGADRVKRDWILKKCDKRKVESVSACNALKLGENLPSNKDRNLYNTTIDSKESDRGVPDEEALNEPHSQPTQQHSTIGGAVTAFVVITIVCSVAAWSLYAFKNPHTRSGQFLIKYRPSQWSWRRGEARYTAATIHM